MTGEGPVLGEGSLIMTGEGVCFRGGALGHDWGGHLFKGRGHWL